MVVTDDTLELVSKSFKNFKVLVLSSCEGFTTDGLASIAANCRLILERGIPTVSLGVCFDVMILNLILFFRMGIE